MNEVRFTISVRDDAGTWAPTANGHNLVYSLGAGRKPGIIVGKKVAKALCPFDAAALAHDDDRRLGAVNRGVKRGQIAV